MLTRVVILIIFLFSAMVPAPAAEQSLGDVLKKIFSTPTPTPHPRKKKTATATKKKSPTPTPSPTPKRSPTPREKESPEPSVSPSPRKKRTPAVEEETPSPTTSPKRKRTPVAEEESPTPTPRKKKTSPTPTPSASPHRKKKGSPSPSPSESPEPSASPSAAPTEAPSPSATPEKKRGAPNATLTPDAIKGFANYPEKVRQVLTSALELTTRNLDYKYGSDDPANGGMDCSGFVYFVLRQNGFNDVPRDSAGQYNWVRKAKTFEPVLSQKENSFELDDLKPGDLLFWTGTYAIERDPPITHAMIYIGRETKNGHRVMVGASDGRVYDGESRYGVSVFDFTIHRAATNNESKLRPTFVGYGHIPGLSE